MDMSIPYILEGEILNVEDFPGTQAGQADSTFGTGSTLKAVTYRCRVMMPDGRNVILANVPEASPFGGIDDYFQTRRRAAEDDESYDLDDIQGSDDTGVFKNGIGERVYIAFVGGSFLRPVIISHMQHPSQTVRITQDDIDNGQPLTFLKHLGIAVSIDVDGQMFLTHLGVPDISYVQGGALGSALGAASSLGSSGSEEPSNPAVKPQSLDYKTTMQFLKLGQWRVNDALGQMIQIDPDAQQIYIANNAIKSTDPVDNDTGLDIAGNDTDSEYVLLDRNKELVLINARKIIQLYSFGKRKDVTEGDHSHKVKGDETITIFGDKTDEIDGSATRTIKADLKEEVSGDVDWNVDGAFNVFTKGDINLKTFAGGGIVVSGSKVEIGGQAAGIFATVSDLMTQLDAFLQAIQAMTVPTAVGPSGPPINIAQFVQVQAQIKILKQKLDTVKGSL